MNNDKLLEVINDVEYANELFKSESWEAAQASLAGKGIEASIDEIKEAFDSLKKMEHGELDDDALENIAGGYAVHAMWDKDDC